MPKLEIDTGWGLVAPMSPEGKRFAFYGDAVLKQAAIAQFWSMPNLLDVIPQVLSNENMAGYYRECGLAKYQSLPSDWIKTPALGNAHNVATCLEAIVGELSLRNSCKFDPSPIVAGLYQHYLSRNELDELEEDLGTRSSEASADCVELTEPAVLDRSVDVTVEVTGDSGEVDQVIGNSTATKILGVVNELKTHNVLEGDTLVNLQGSGVNHATYTVCGKRYENSHRRAKVAAALCYAEAFRDLWGIEITHHLEPDGIASIVEIAKIETVPSESLFNAIHDAPKYDVERSDALNRGDDAFEDEFANTVADVFGCSSDIHPGIGVFDDVDGNVGHNDTFLEDAEVTLPAQMGW